MAVKASASISLTRVNDGATGNGIKSIVNKYLATNVNTGVTVGTSGWTTSIQTITTSNKYLWNHEIITYTNNSTTTTTPIIIGVYGDKGATGNTGATGSTGATGAAGKGIKSIVEKYAVSSSNSTAPTAWLDTIPTMTTSNKYLWNYEIITYTDNTTYTSGKRVIGVYGNTGNTGATGGTGTGVSAIIAEYYLSTSKTSQTGGSWKTTPDAWSKGKYMWIRNKITYTNPSSTAYTTPICDSSWEVANTVDEKVEVVKKEVATLTTTTNNISAKVTSVETTVKNIKVGGVNLAKETKKCSKVSGVGTTAGGWVKEEVDGFTALAIVTTNTSWQECQMETYLPMNSVTGKVTISFDYQSTVTDLLMVSIGVFNGGSRITEITNTTAGAASTSWKRGYVTFDSLLTSDNLSYVYKIQFKKNNGKTGTCKVKRVKFEVGNYNTDWSPAPEDIDADLNDAYEQMSTIQENVTKSYESAINVAVGKVSTTVSETYAKKTDLSSSEERLSAKMDLTSKDLNLSFTKATNDIKNDVQGFKDEVTTYIRFDANGMELGKLNNRFKAKLTNEKLSFLQDNAEVAYISNNKMYITDAEIRNNLILGNFSFVPRSNGNLSLKWMK